MVSALTLHSSDILSLLDGEGRLIFNSPATERISGFTPEELAGLDTFELIHPDDRAAVREVFGKMLSTAGATHLVQYRYRTKGGGWVWMEATASNQLDNPAVRGVVANSRDITERRRLEEQRLRSRQLESLSTLSGGVAHDFNNLLSVVLAEASLLSASSSGAVRESAAHIQQAARRAADLTQLLLACAGESRFTRAPLSLPALAAELEPELRASIGPRTELFLTVDPKTPAIEAAVERLRELILQLVLNASQALPDSGGKVTVNIGQTELSAAQLQGCRLDYGLAPGPAVFIEVSDSGRGISAQTMEHLFEPYFSSRELGRGLGLAAVAGIVRGFHGAIDVRSAEGRGTTLTAWFASSNAPAPVKKPVTGWQGEGLVLVVDDEPETAKVACRLLHALGFKTETAIDGLDALERFGLSLDRFRAVLLDVSMPRLDGPETFLRMRATNAQLPVIFYSGYDQGLVEQGLSQPRTSFLQKPFDLTSLEACLRQLLPGER